MSISLEELNFNKAIDYHYDCFPPKDLNYHKIIPQLTKATDAIARFDQMLKKMHNSEIFLAPLRNQEAVISSRMEGTISTIDEILKYEADYDENNKAQQLTRSEVLETILYQRALKSAQNALESGQPLSQFLLKTTHQHLLSFGRGAHKTPGKYKTEQNYLADKTMKNILFIPISPQKLQDGVDALFDYIANNDDVALLKTAIAHIEFEALHPFKDGNGRIGRMLITLMLWSNKVISAPHFYISGYFEEHKDRYIDMMRDVSQNNNWTDWCIFFLQAIEEQAVKNLQIAEQISALYEQMKEHFRQILSSKYSINALDYVFTNPVFRNNKFTSNSNIPHSTAARFTRILLEKNLLITFEEASGRKPAMYAFEPLLELVRV